MHKATLGEGVDNDKHKISDNKANCKSLDQNYEPSVALCLWWKIILRATSLFEVYIETCM